MPRKKKPVEVQIVPTSVPALVPQALSADQKAFLLKCMDEMLAAGCELETFRPAEVAKASRRINYIFDRQKWGLYFEKWGCLACGKTAAAHAFNGLCSSCAGRTMSRLQKIKHDFEKGHPEIEIVRNIERLTSRVRSAEELLGGGE